MTDYYAVLGVERKARLGEVKKAYRKLARKYHPDLNPDDKRAEDRFKQITEAYDVLSDSERRRKHDRELEYGEGFAAAGAGGRDWDPATAQDFGFDLGDLGGSGPGLSSFFSEIFGRRDGQAQEERGPRRGDDVTRALAGVEREPKSLRLTDVEGARERQAQLAAADRFRTGVGADHGSRFAHRRAQLTHALSRR